ncbi:MAG: hypothetical protein R2713_00925 [Ilumatobacteraceae bacterium]
MVLGTHNVHPGRRVAGARRAGPITEILDEAVIDDHALFPSALPARANVVQRMGHDPDRVRQLVCVLHRPGRAGAEISRPFDDVVAEVRDLADQGSPRSPCSARTSTATAATCRWPPAATAARTPGSAPLRRSADPPRRRGAGIRRGAIHQPAPEGHAPETFAAMAASPQVCEHLHYPLQSGSDQVLSLMHRGYRRAVPRSASRRRARPSAISP